MMLRRSAALAGAICALLGAGPAYAQVEWGAAQSAFEDGLGSGVSAQTDGEYALCAAFWSVWTDALQAGGLASALPESMDDRLASAAAGTLTLDWLAIVEARQLEPAFTTEMESAGGVLGKVLAKDLSATIDFFEVLGVCVKLPEAE